MLDICIIMRDNLKVHMIYIYRSDQTFIFLSADCPDKVAHRHNTVRHSLLYEDKLRFRIFV